MAVVASAPVLPNQKKTVLQNRPIHWRTLYIKETIQKHSTNNIRHSKYKYTYYLNTHTIFKTPTHYKTHTYTHPHITKQVKTTTVQDTHQIK